MFGRDFQQLIRKAEHKLFVEESHEKQTELRELIGKLSNLVYPEPGQIRLTSHYYLIYELIA
ncbi:hypothetical protein D770_22080 [Flammeovirgaceae bacterium 311]|nr:hypothetical protein D770_22080 [Flammeovirgaceae bacterium 311]